MHRWIAQLVGWQKIRSAPKDGTLILVSGDGNIGVITIEGLRLAQANG